MKKYMVFMVIIFVAVLFLYLHQSNSAYLHRGHGVAVSEQNEQSEPRQKYRKPWEIGDLR